MIEETNELLHLPKGWTRTKLGDIVEPSRESVQPTEFEEVKYIGLEHIEKDTGKLVGCGNSKEVRSTKSRFRRGDLLYGKLRPYLNKAHVADFDGVCSTDILVFPANSFLSSKFLVYRFLGGDFVRFASQNVSGVQHPRVSFATLSRFELALPPTNEQHRIASKVEELFSCLDAGVESLLKVKTLLKRYRQAVLKYAFEGKLTEEWRKIHKDQIAPAQEPVEHKKQERKYEELPPIDTSTLPELPDGWSWIRVTDISEMIQYGTSEKAGNDPHGVAVLRMGNIQDGRLIFGDLKYLPEDWPQLQELLLEEGDVLFNRTNSAELVGKTAIYERHHPKAVFASYLIRIRVNRKAYVPSILSHFINSFYGRKHIASVVSQQVGQANVNGTKLSLMPIPLIPFEEQQEISREIELNHSIIDATERNVEQTLVKSEQMRQSILKMAFAGKLVPQDPADESADKLLERIRGNKMKQERKGKASTRDVGLMHYVK